MRQALYRKYRPKTFDEVYGQANIVKILKNQIEHEKISHAYLFSGTRGTGKTSCAKIFSRAVNCLNPKDGNPCNECENCRAIFDESTMDVVEMDAASNRRIDDIRQLRDMVIYPPTDLKYKVYIIDEAHMITTEGFNALLKIMEEPPKHLVFILATTEIDKIPDTILSRTQRFEFKTIDNASIEERIEDILEKENIKMDYQAVNAISNIGKGSMRDALSVLDQVISIDDDSFNMDQINDILGIVGDKTKNSIIQSMLNSDAKNIVSFVDMEIEKGKDSYNIIKELIGYFELLLDIKVSSTSKLTKVSKEVLELANKISLDRIINSLDILMDYEKKIKKSDNRNLLLKMSMIRLIDSTPRDLLEKKVDALQERISRVESLDFSEIVSKPKANKDPNFEEVIEPVEVTENGFLGDYAEEVNSEKGVDEQGDIEELEKSTEDQVEEDADKKVDKIETKVEESKEEIIKHEAPQELENKNDDRGTTIEKQIRFYALKKFPSSITLFNEVEEFTVKNDILTYWVTEKGMTFAQIMSNVFEKTQAQYRKQMKIDIEIKFLKKPDAVKELVEDNESQKRIEKIRGFFGDDLEIID